MRFWPFGKKEKPKRKLSRRSYAAAASSRLLADWITSTTSADEEIRSSLVKLRNRSRDLCRNNDYAKSAIRVIKNNVIGEGIPFQAQVKKLRGKGLDQDTNQDIENQWFEWSRAENCHVAGRLSFNDMEMLIGSSLPKNGEILFRIHREQYGTSKVPLALELLSSDMLDENYNVASTATENEVRMGIELDVWKKPVAYWFHTKHPGDWGTIGSYGNGIGPRVRVPARDIIHLFAQEDEEQTRGVPWFASTILRLNNMGGYEESEIVAARAGAAIMGFIETPEGELEGDEETDDGELLTDFEPGTFKNLPPGSKMNIPTISRPGGQFEPFMKIMLRGVAAGCGASYSSISRDYSDSNYSSSRQGLLEDRDNWRVLQNWVVRNFHQRIYEEFLSMAYLGGVFDWPLYPTRPELYRYPKWLRRGWGWIDPLKEVEASALAVENGFKTLTEIHAEQGSDFEEYCAIRKRELDLLKENGILVTSDPSLLKPPAPAQPKQISPSADKDMR